MAKPRPGSWAAAAILLAAAWPAQACRELIPNPEDLAGYRTVVLVDIEASTRLDSPGWNSWAMTARRERVIAGSSNAAEYAFRATLTSTGCGRTPLPAAGERWVLYVAPAEGGHIERAFPLDYVRPYDPRLKRIH